MRTLTNIYITRKVPQKTIPTIYKARIHPYGCSCLLLLVKNFADFSCSKRLQRYQKRTIFYCNISQKDLSIQAICLFTSLFYSLYSFFSICLFYTLLFICFYLRMQNYYLNHFQKLNFPFSLLMSFSTFLSNTLAYICVVLTLLCPSIFDTVSNGTSLLSVMVVAKVWRAI